MKGHRCGNAAGLKAALVLCVLVIVFLLASPPRRSPTAASPASVVPGVSVGGGDAVGVAVGAVGASDGAANVEPGGLSATREDASPRRSPPVPSPEESRLAASRASNVASCADRFDGSTILVSVPPPQLMFMHEDNYKFLQIGIHSARLLETEIGAINSPDTHLLDMGSGYGRLFTGIALHHGSGLTMKYTGMDILSRHVKWCQQNYMAKYPGIAEFLHIDVYNSRYNPKGSYQVQEWAIPNSPSTFTHVCLFSVFTHMHEGDILHYLKEFERVLKPGGKAWCNVFFYNEARRAKAMSSKYGNFAYNSHTLIKSREDPLFAIVFEEDWFIKNIIEPSGLKLVKIVYGTHFGIPPGSKWKGLDGQGQDAFVVEKLY